ncbi:MAG: hypothetical protein ABEJ04_01550 [Halobacteriaceae archaeon]
MATADVSDSAFDLEDVLRWCRGAVEAVAFWTAVALPAAYLPLLGVRPGPESVTLAVALLVLEVVALLVGHGHAADRP